MSVRTISTILNSVNEAQKLHDRYFPTVQREWDRVFSDFFSDKTANKVKAGVYPKMDSCVEGDRYVIRVATPGVKKEDLSVEIEDVPVGNSQLSINTRVLRVSGQMYHEQKDVQPSFEVRELVRGKFIREFELPDGIKGDPELGYSDGLLTVYWSYEPPSKSPKPTKKHLEIK